MNDTLLHALMRYRQCYGLPPLPTSEEQDEQTALFMNFNGSNGVSANMIYRLVKNLFLACATRVEKERPECARTLRKASTHWLRHTAITHQTDAGIELRYIKRTARHNSVETTLLYQHVEEDRWHAAMSQHTTAFGQTP